MPYQLKTKISTPRIEDSVAFFQRVLGMVTVEAWSSEGDHGVILSFDEEASGALLEIYSTEEPSDFKGLSLQFRVHDLEVFLETLPADCPFDGPRDRPWGARYLYLKDPNGISVIVYEGCL